MLLQRHCIWIDATKLNSDGSFAKLDSCFTEVIDHAVGHRYPTLEFSLTGRTTFVEDVARKCEHFIQQTVQNLRPMTSWACITTMLILDRKRRKRRGNGQANAQVSFEATKRAPIGYCYRCTISIFLFMRWHLLILQFPLLVYGGIRPAFAWMGDLAARLQEAGYDWDRDMVVGAVIAPEDTVHVTETSSWVNCLFFRAARRIARF